ncbi:ABC transporter permease [Proteiniborus sp.]|uniref:ABC transporter permease n=1 Tax=Proteiniborus sp. TaxID=2079015 RepID=UPI0033230D35
MKLAFSIATRFLKSSKGQTALIAIGIAIGVSVQIFIGSLIDGLQLSLIDKTIGSSSHITIQPKGKENYFEDNDEIINKLRKDDRFTAVSKSLDASGFVLQDEETYPVLMRGFEFENANNIYKLDEKLIEGNLPSSSMEILLGKNLVQELGFKIGDKVSFLTPDGRYMESKLVGVFDLKVASLNKSWSISTIDNVGEIFEKEGSLSTIETQIEEVFDADIIAKSLDSYLQEFELESSNWKVQNEELLSGLAGQSASSIMIQVFVLLAVLLGIASVLAISVIQKSRQIGILKAMGIKDKDASLIFLFQGLLLGVIGSIIGTGLGISFSYIFSTFVKNPDGTPLVPFYLDIKFVGLSVAIAIASSTIAALIPARKSSKLNPIEVIKNG